MATYREIKGLTVQSLSDDPSLSSGNEGQVWFNSGTGKLKALVQIGAWASTANVTTLRSHCGGAGTQTAGLIFGGLPYTGATEEFNGTGWATQGGSLNTARGSMGSLGTSTAALFMGGDTAPTYVANVEEWDGTSWSEEANIPTAATDVCGVGIQTAGLSCGGNSPTMQSAVNLYNGSSWSSETAMPTTRDEAAGSGTSTAALVAAGHSPGTGDYATTSIEYDGTSWTDGGTLPTAHAAAGCSKAGTQTAAIIFGGMTGPTAPTTIATAAQYNGTAWTATGSMAAAKRYLGCGGSSTAAFAACGMGVPPTKTTTAEVFNQSTNVTTAGAWSSGGNLSTSGSRSGVGATTNAAIVMGASAPPSYTLSNQTELYDGTAWTTSPATLQTAVSNNSSAGTSTSAVSFGGQNPSPTGQTEEWDGTSWATSPGSMTNPAYGRFGFGTLTAAVSAGGYPPGTLVKTEEYDGATWSTSPGDMTTARYDGGSTGILTAGLAFGGQSPLPAPGVGDATEEYGGTTWAAGGTMLATHHNIKGFGTQTATTTIGQGITYGVKTYYYDGTAWSTNPNNTTPRGMQGGTAGTSTAGLGAGGYGPGYFNATEEWTGATETATASNITSS